MCIHPLTAPLPTSTTTSRYHLRPYTFPIFPQNLFVVPVNSPHQPIEEESGNPLTSSCRRLHYRYHGTSTYLYCVRNKIPFLFLLSLFRLAILLYSLPEVFFTDIDYTTSLSWISKTADAVHHVHSSMSDFCWMRLSRTSCTLDILRREVLVVRSKSGALSFKSWN